MSRQRHRGIAAIAILATASLLWIAPQPARAAGYTKTPVSIAVTVGPSGSTHRCTIAADLYRPSPAAGPNSTPAVLTTNGFGGSKDDQAGLGEYLAPRGYVVLAYSGLGFGGSTCNITLDDPDYDGKAASQLITWLATPANVPEIKLDKAGDPRVGMIGGSYGGAVQFATAAQDPRLDAIIPIITWNDLGYSLAPNNTSPSLVFRDTPPGVSKFEWTELFFVDGISQPLLHPSTTPVPPSPCPGFEPSVCTADATTFALGYPTPSTLRLLRHASMVGYDRAGQVHIPTMLMQGEADTLFNLDEAVANARLIKATGAPVKLVLQSWGHSNQQPQPGEYDPKNPAGMYETGLIQNWFDHYLQGSRVSTGSPVEYFRDYAYNGTAAGIAAAYGHAASYPIGTPVKLYPSADGSLRTKVAGVTSGAPLMLNPPLGFPASYSETSGVQSTSPFTSIPPFDPPGEAVSFTSAPVTAPVAEVGIPSLRLTVNAPLTSNLDPALQPELFTKIYDVAPDGSVTLPERLVAPARLPAGQSTVTLTLPGIVHQFAPGHRIRVVISSTDLAYLGSRAPGVISFPITPSAPDVLTMPVDGSTAGITGTGP